MSFDPSKENPLKAILVAVVIALLVGGSAPWWWKTFFDRNDSALCYERIIGVDPTSISTSSSDSTVEDGDDEIHSDDWTSVKISYEIYKVNDDRELKLTIKWHAQERNKHKKKSDTKIVSQKTFHIVPMDSLCPESKIIEINGLVLEAKKVKYYKGQRWSFHSFPNFGSLTNIQVQFDGEGRGDDQRQALNAVLNTFSIKRSEVKNNTL